MRVDVQKAISRSNVQDQAHPAHELNAEDLFNAQVEVPNHVGRVQVLQRSEQDGVRICNLEMNVIAEALRIER